VSSEVKGTKRKAWLTNECALNQAAYEGQPDVPGVSVLKCLAAAAGAGFFRSVSRIPRHFGQE
jgi:hypothetical protein